MKIYRYILSLAPVLGAVTLAAQNYNPTVVVTNKYKVETLTPEKESIEMAVPDSVKRFDMSFDYTVFEHPYQGSYDFSPYSVDMKPMGQKQRAGKFYLNAGIGYTLHPELDFIYTPLCNEKASLDIYLSHSSFDGNYRKIGLNSENGKMAGLKTADGKRDYWGLWNYDMDNSLGAALRYDWQKLALTADLGYKGLQQMDWMRGRSFDSGVANVRVFSKDTLSQGLTYDVRLRYLLGYDKVNRLYDSRLKTGENDVNLALNLGFNAGENGRFIFDLGADISSYVGSLTHTATLFTFTPTYILTLNGWTFDLGVRVAVPFTTKGAGLENYAHSQYAYPAVKISYDFRKIPLNIYLSLTGGETQNSYSSLVGQFRHYTLASAALGSTHAVLGNNVERFNATFGLKGRVRSVFGYEAFVGFAERATSAVETIRVADVTLGETTYVALPYYDLTFARTGLLRAGGKFHYSDDWGRVDLGLLYSRMWTYGEAPQILNPASLTGDASVKFNIIKRIYATVGCEFSLARKGWYLDSENATVNYTIPGYGDPYLGVEYRHNRLLSVWAKARQFTGQTIQRTPLYAEQGPEITVGVRLNFGK